MKRPEHCDDERTIAPNSDIYTISLGVTSTLKFNNLYSGKQEILSIKDRSLYMMSRKSQAVWAHGIEKSAEFQGVRYAITFRTVGKRFNRSTAILGDSNTKHLKFGKGKGTFGFNMPGETVYTPLIDHLDPWKCVGYSNIIVHCGVNNIKNHSANVPEAVDKLIRKVEAIKSLCPNAKLTINPLLPTRSDLINAKAKQFNTLLFNYMDRKADPLIQALNFDVFVDERSHLLKSELGRYNHYDILHLGSVGVRLLVKLVKVRVCGSRVDGRAYSSVNSMNSERVQGRRGTVRSERSRESGMNMMRAATTTSNEFPALSQHTES